VTWDDGTLYAPPQKTLLSWVRVLLRGAPMALVVFGGLLVLLLVRLIERPFWGHARPFTPAITVYVCRTALRILGLGIDVHGAPMVGRGAIVANHGSWLDIFVLNAISRIYFVSKSEVAGWPGIGWLARATGTVFIERNPARAREQTHVFRDRLLMGHKLLFFPEGTSTDGQRVLGFKTSLFAAFLESEVRQDLFVQPVSVVYHAPLGADPRFYGWWGETSFGSHLLAMLAAPRHGRVDIVHHSPIEVVKMPHRKALARACEAAVRAGFEAYVKR
jgi:1-acyl-sn-glycerol-3-phosphate acyltransferase